MTAPSSFLFDISSGQWNKNVHYVSVSIVECYFTLYKTNCVFTNVFTKFIYKTKHSILILFNSFILMLSNNRGSMEKYKHIIGVQQDIKKNNIYKLMTLITKWLVY